MRTLIYQLEITRAWAAIVDYGDGTSVSSPVFRRREEAQDWLTAYLA